ncbi:uncharacterized protein SEPMUDRAFT_163217 [Sphaerulina musiva SO2202]|uniref:Peptidase S54 rhomboid domain-containing protein n=1 Tax=Sphaerulina musiva (strain SO2202) TaxID=692275 RepID=M3D6N0_SPHMS|nr:uncharacterized protein SEPMUDRAFT_163217 [Sphaerulina musiva SO2202]EMF13529.1 hypothetical protein SEPMUDRAFT_163217 [Sphaerulina musiva SO2202]
MHASGFANAPVTRVLVIATVVISFLATLTDTKYYAWIDIRPHLFDYHQFWRLFTWQLCYTNSTEVLFATMTLYNLRVIERLWSSRKFASFLVSTYIYNALIPPILLAAVIRPLSLGRINLPAGPTPMVFALLAQYHAAIPYIYKYRLSGSTTANAQDSSTTAGLMLTSKATSYLLPLQLALSQLPGSAITAAVGWAVGWAYRREILPGATRWRLPTWVLGGSEQKERYDNLRRRLEGEAGTATGVETNTDDRTRRRGVLGGLADQFRGAF